MSKHNKGNGIYFETESTTGWIFNKDFIPTGRIKRMRTKGLKGMGFLMFKYDMLRFCQRNIETPKLTRWNRH